ncbi:MAG: hypothetical protein E7316_05115 [Clostridiales bacterium]|nr:hypothetical protein [Clostridiales bacterium]
MRRREMLNLFVTEYQADPATGKEKRVARYIGPWYTLEKQPRRACTLKCAAGWLLCLAAFITAGMIPSWAGLCNYVVPWYILCLLPLFYLLLGVIKLARLKPEFTAVDESESLGYIRASSLGLAALGGLWSITTVIFLLATDRAMTLPQELIFLGCGVVTATMGVLAYLAARRAPVQAKEKEAAAETAPETTGEEIIS